MPWRPSTSCIPGHVRHLLYAKSKADILVASLTADAHIAKANFRPFVPQELRAIIWPRLRWSIMSSSTRIRRRSRTSRCMQPDYLRQRLRIHAAGPASARRGEEIEPIESYGGEILFTPGDIIYSSSRIIENEPPTIAIEKLMTLMARRRSLDKRRPRRQSTSFDGIARTRGRRHDRRQPTPIARLSAA